MAIIKYGIHKVDTINKEFWDIDLWGCEEDNKDGQLTILVNDEELFYIFTKDSKWIIATEDEDYEGFGVFIEALDDNTIGRIITL